MQSQRTMYRLVFENRAEPRPPVVTVAPLLVIGRDDTCQLRLLENGISDRHAAIERRRDGYYVRDLDSANGIRVNGQAVHEQRLASGDELELAAVRLLFEIVHAPACRRILADPLQLASISIVAVSILAQLAVLGWIFSEPRHRDMPIDSGLKPRARAPGVAATAGQDVLRAADPFAPIATVQSSAPATPRTPPEPVVLNRLIRIVRVDRVESGSAMTLNIVARAQVGERELDPRATAICVQFFTRDAAGRPLGAEPLWLQIPRWENFTAQTFSVSFPGPAAQVAGYVVRTYYRQQLQDVSAVPPTLLAMAAAPTP